MALNLYIRGHNEVRQSYATVRTSASAAVRAFMPMTGELADDGLHTGVVEPGRGAAVRAGLDPCLALTCASVERSSVHRSHLSESECDVCC